MSIRVLPSETRLEALPHHRRWAAIVALLYAVLLAAMSGPVAFALFWPDPDVTFTWWPDGNWQYWVILAALVTAQFGLLATRIEGVSRRPSGRGALVLPVSAGLLGGALVAGAFVSVVEFVKGEHTPDWTGWLAVALAVATWGAWTWVFRNISRHADGGDIVGRVCGQLLRGSVLELLVAVPTHVVARRRGYCCAGVYTGVGIGLGVAVMLASYGPAVFILFADRWRRLHPREGAKPLGLQT